MTQEKRTWRNHKDRLFRKLFSEKENALSLYNALNGTSYEKEDELKIVTLEDAIYLTMKNDVAVCLTVFKLYRKGRSYEEIARIMGISIEQIRKMLD